MPTLTRYFRLFWLMARLSVQDTAAYRLDFLMHFVLAFVQLGAELVTLWTIFSNTRSLAGWQPLQILGLLGVFRIMVGTIAMIVAPNMRTMMEEIRDGKLDYAILKPVSTQFYVSVRRVVLWRLSDIALGLALVTFSAIRLAGSVSLSNVLLFLVMIAAGVTIIYSFWLVLGTMAFWFTRINNIEMVFWNVFEAGRYPVSIYRPAVRWTLTYIIPLAFLTTFPAQTLVHSLDPRIVALALVFAVTSAAGATLFFRYGLRHYSGASA